MLKRLAIAADVFYHLHAGLDARLQAVSVLTVVLRWLRAQAQTQHSCVHRPPRSYL